MTRPANPASVAVGMAPADSYATSVAVVSPLDHTIRSTAMLLLNEELARHRARELQAEAAQARLVHRIRVARKWQRRAERATRMARLTAAQVQDTA